MTLFQIQYRATVFDTDDTTVLSVGGDDFKVITKPGVSGWQPYLDTVKGRFGRLDLLTKRTDMGEWIVILVDQRTTAGGSNLERYITQFMGNAEDRPQLIRRKWFMEESLDDGATWASFFTGRIHQFSLLTRAMVQVVIRDMSTDLDKRVFVGQPHSSITYAQTSLLMPHGMTTDHGTYGDSFLLPVVAPTPGSVLTSINRQFSIVIDTDVQRRQWIVGGPWDELLRQKPSLITQTGERLVAIPGKRERAYRTWEQFEIPDSLARGVRVRIKHTSGAESGNTGSYTLKIVEVMLLSETLPVVSRMACDVLRKADGQADSLHAEFLAAPAAAVTVEITISHNQPPTETSSFQIDDVVVGTLIGDILDGDFSLLDSSGNQAFPISYDSATANPGRGLGAIGITALIADTSHAEIRALVTSVGQRNDWIERFLLQTAGLAYRFNADGEFTVLDVRMPSSLAGLQTIADSDLVENIAPRWASRGETAVNQVRVTTYFDAVLGILFGAEAGGPLFTTRRDELLVDFETADAGDREITIDAVGLRDDASLDFTGVPFGPQSRTEWVRRRARALVEEYRSMFAHGTQEAIIVCRRTTAVNATEVGDVVLVTVSELPDPQTNERGGTLAMRVVEKNIRGPRVELALVHMGVNAVASVPTLGAVAQETGNTKHGVELDITVNAQSDPVWVEYAVTPTSTGTRPVEDSNRWTFGLYVTATGTVAIRPFGSTLRVWIRGHSRPQAAQSPSMPSAYVFPSGTGRIDTAAISPPTSATITEIEGGRVLSGWANGDTDYAIEVLLDGTQQTILPSIGDIGPGTSYRLTGLTVSTTYNSPGFEVRHVDPWGGVSTLATKTFTTTATKKTAPTPVGPLYVTEGIQ